jgi:hypothetical protein
MSKIILFYLLYTFIMIGFAWGAMGIDEIYSFLLSYIAVSFLLVIYVGLNNINQSVNNSVCDCEHDEII